MWRTDLRARVGAGGPVRGSGSQGRRRRWWLGCGRCQGKGKRVGLEMEFEGRMEMAHLRWTPSDSPGFGLHFPLWCLAPFTQVQSVFIAINSCLSLSTPHHNKKTECVLPLALMMCFPIVHLTRSPHKTWWNRHYYLCFMGDPRAQRAWVAHGLPDSKGQQQDSIQIPWGHSLVYPTNIYWAPTLFQALF